MLRYPKTLALVAGLVSATGFEPLGLWPLTLVMFALLKHLVARAETLRRSLAIGYWFGIGHFTVGLNWIAHAFTYQDKMPWQLGYGAVVALALYLAVYPAMAAGLAWRWGSVEGIRSSRAKSRGVGAHPRPSTSLGMNGLSYVLIFAAAWIVTEWLRATMFTGFAWNPLGVTALGTPLAPSAQAIGTYGLSGLLILAGGGIWLLVRRRWLTGGIIFAALAIRAAWSLVAAADPAPADAGQPLIRVIQPNIGQREKQDPAFDAINFRRLARLTGRPGPEPRLILWPEAAIPDFLEEEPLARARIASLIGPHDMLLTGGVALEADENRRVIGARNSLFAVTPEGALVARYDKAHLVPYGEYLPMRPILSAIGLSRLVPGDLDFWPGLGPRTIDVPGFGAVGVQICYEIIFSGQVVEPGNRPRFLFNPSNDAWFGAWGPPQHLAQARLRAIEEAMPVVRSTPTGISAVIDADGRMLANIPHGTAGVIETRLPPPGPPTPFARLGNLLSFAFALLLVGLAVVIGRRAR